MLGVQCSAYVCQMVWHLAAAVCVPQDRWLLAVALKSVVWRELSFSAWMPHYVLCSYGTHALHTIVVMGV
jgi:hypothetical protein